MSTKPSDDESTAAASERDASFALDTSSLGADELDFAKSMGFGDEPVEEPAPAVEAKPSPAPAPAPESIDEPVAEFAAAEDSVEVEAEDEKLDESEAESDEGSESAEDAVTDEDVGEAEDAAPIAASEENPGDDPDQENDWEEIHPRPSPDGDQGLLQTRAREVLAFVEPDGAVEDRLGAPAITPSSPPPPSATIDEPVHDAFAAAIEPAPGPSVNHDEFIALEKERDALSSEFEALNTEHGLLLDHQSAVQGQLIRSNEEVERLRASLRAARNSLAPLPEGERALRAEIIGIRDRLEAAHAENQRLGVACETRATELAIAQARFEDRQHEVDVRLDEIDQLQRALDEAQHAAQAHTERQRELLNLSTRLQAENNELRSAQSALEETLTARNLEIDAREEHLAVTREGLLARDRQIIDLNAALEASRAEVERAESELARRDVDAEQNRRAIERREIRIASLSETLANIESVMGHRSEPLALGDRPSTPIVPPPATPSAGIAPSHSADSGLILASYDDVFRGQAESDEVDAASTDTDSKEATKAELRPPRALLTPWRNGCLSEWMGALGAETLLDYYAAHLARAFPSGWPEPLRIRSLGGDQIDAEIRLLEALENRGVTSVEVNVWDANPERATQRTQKAEAAGWASQISVQIGHLWDAAPEPKADAILLLDALYGCPDADRQLEACKEALSESGLLLFADQLRGGPMTLSEDTLRRLEEIWAVLPESIAELPGFSEIPAPGEHGGIPDVGGPGLETLFADFVSRADVGFGHLADLVVGPARGAWLSEEDPATKRLLYSIFGLDESRSITESLPSRHGVGIFAKNQGGDSAAAAADLFAPEWLVAEVAESATD